jgi:replicative DNA helicase
MSYKSLYDAISEAEDYIIKRKNGQAPSLLTPFQALNRAGVDGIPWQSNFVIGARSGVGKTLIKDQILYKAWELNPTQNIRVLDFSLEMPLRASGLRNIMAELKCDKNMLLSAQGEEVSKNTLRQIQKIKASTRHTPWNIIDTPMSVSNMHNRILNYYQEFGNDIKLIVSVDHSLLIKPKSKEDTKAILSDYGAMITDIRKSNEAIFFTLSQLNRNILESHRMANGKAENFPKTSDLYGADALLHYADSVLLLNRPAEFGITEYGPNKIPIVNPNYIGAHLVKSRNGQQGIIHMQANYENFEFVEIPEPVAQLNPFKS